MKNDTMKLLESIQNNLNEDEYEGNVNHSTLPKPTNKSSFEGFDISKVSNDDKYKLYQEFLDNPDTIEEEGFNGAYVTEMTPQEYMDLSRLYVKADLPKLNDLSKLSDLNGEYSYFAKICYDFADKMKQGDKFPLPILDFRYKEQDGRHRVIAAYINNYSTIPVLICY